MTGFVLRISQGAGDYPLGPITRSEVESQIETLITLLDRMDGDADFEPDPDGEPYLGWSHTMAIGDRTDLEQGEVAA